MLLESTEGRVPLLLSVGGKFHSFLPGDTAFSGPENWEFENKIRIEIMYSSNSSLTIEGYLLPQMFSLNGRGYYFIHNLLCYVDLNSKDENQA